MQRQTCIGPLGLPGGIRLPITLCLCVDLVPRSSTGCHPFIVKGNKNDYLT
jgi:hypothetical protein